MIAILSPNYNPYFNIALEYYLLHELDEDILLVYRNETSVIVGKHQNAFAEANQQFIHQANIPLVRRISGGGTVFHDLGNINITIIRKGKLKFMDLLQPIREVLYKLNIDTEISEKNDLLVDKKKITGTAAHIYKEKTLHHATLLYNASQEILHKSLNGKKECFIDKGVRSRPSPTINLIDCLNVNYTNEQFADFMWNELKQMYGVENVYKLNEHDVSVVNDLVKNKFSSWNWNYAFSPSFEFVNSIFVEGVLIQLSIQVKNGCIEKATLVNNGKTYELTVLNTLPFIQLELINTLSDWSKKNCPTLKLSSFEKLLKF